MLIPGPLQVPRLQQTRTASTPGESVHIRGQHLYWRQSPYPGTASTPGRVSTPRNSVTPGTVLTPRTVLTPGTVLTRGDSIHTGDTVHTCVGPWHPVASAKGRWAEPCRGCVEPSCSVVILCVHFLDAERKSRHKGHHSPVLQPLYVVPVARVRRGPRGQCHWSCLLRMLPGCRSVYAAPVCPLAVSAASSAASVLPAWRSHRDPTCVLLRAALTPGHHLKHRRQDGIRWRAAAV